MAGLVQELKRRNVFRVGVAYVVVAWLILQFTDLVLENVSAPEWVMQVFMLGLAIGLPIAVFFAWAFELTPEGLKTTKDVDRSDSVTHNTGRKLDRMIIVVLIVAVAYFVWERQTQSEKVEELTATPSLAVLPFVNMSGNADNEYFSDGITEEILNSIVRLKFMDVIGRTSSFQFKGQNLDLRAIAETLDVSHILEGSVRRDNDKVRITAQLIEADSGYHLWSDTYDRDLVDILNVQSEVAKAIADELKLTLVESDVDSPTFRNSEAYDLYLRSKQALIDYTFTSLSKAHRWLDRAIELDPEFGLLYVIKAQAYADGAVIGMLSNEEAAELVLALIETAKDYGAGNTGEWYRARAYANFFLGNRSQTMIDIRRAYEIDPSDSDIAQTYVNSLNSGREDTLQAIDLLQRSSQNDPLNYWFPVAIARRYERLLQFDKADATWRRSIEMAPDAPTPAALYGRFLANSGELAAGTIQVVSTISTDPSDPESYTFPGQMMLSMGDYVEARAFADRALAINPKSAEARQIKAVALYLDPALAEDPAAAPEVIEAMLEATLSDPDTLYRRIGTGMLDFQAYLALLEGEPDRALAQFESHADIPKELTGDPATLFNIEDDDWVTLAIHARLLREAGQTEQANNVASRLEWINEDIAIARAGGALNSDALRFLIDTRAGLVEEDKIIGWITQLHDVGALYEWRRYLPVHTGLLLMEDQQGLADVFGIFEQSSAAGLSEYVASVSGT
jgi:TolB-like protein/cytochrome c-type biogenesis protein CcmH/NrfG